MRRLFLAVLPVALLFVAGCADSHEKVVRDMIATMNDLCDIMEKIETPADVDKYKADLEKVADRMTDIDKRVDKLGDMSEEQQKLVSKQFAEEMNKVKGRMNALAAKKRKPEAQAKLHEIFRNIDFGRIAIPIGGDMLDMDEAVEESKPPRESEAPNRPAPPEGK